MMLTSRRTLPVVLLLGPLLVPLASAELMAVDDDPVPSYRVRFPERANHSIEVTAELPTDGRDSLDLWMAVWTPGSYKIRDYSRHVEDLIATTPAGTPIPVEKTEKSRWLVSCAGIDRVRLSYRVYCREMSVRTNWVEQDFAMLNGAPTWIVPRGSEDAPYDVAFELPEAWAHCETGLTPHPSGEAHRFRAPDYDTLVDCPVVLGTFDIRSFEVEGVPHFLVSHGGAGLWDFEEAAEDCRRIVEVQAGMWGSIPTESYRFLNMIVEGGGGLEHSNSTLMLTSRYSFRDEDRYRSWLGLVSHEYYHTWNVKRLRPVALGPFDYTREVHTDDLWVVEGITSYADDLSLARAGLTDRKHYLKELSKQVERVQTTPGRKVHALSDTSHDAWTHHYQRHENSPNVTISYYTKGAVVAWLLDAEIRRATEGERTLDDAMRLAYRLYSGERGYTSAEFRECCSELAGRDLSGFFARAVDSTEELEYEPALEWFGLRFRPSEAEEEEAEAEEAADEPAGDAEDADSEEDDREPGWIGLRVSSQGGRMVISEVRRETIAYDAGLNVGDEVIALDGLRILPGQWGSRMEQYEPGDTLELLVARRGALRTIPLTLGTRPEESWKLEVVKDATPAQLRRLASWLGASGEDLTEKADAREEESVPGADSGSAPAPQPAGSPPADGEDDR